MANLPALEIKDEITEVGVMLDDSIKSVDNKLNIIGETLKSIFVVNETTLKKLQGIFDIESDRRQDELLDRGLDLEAEREANQPKGDGGKVERVVDKIEGAGSRLGLGLLAAGSLAYAFADQFKDVVNSVGEWLDKLGIGKENLDNTVAALAAQRFAQPKGYVAPKPTTPKPPKVAAPKTNLAKTPATQALKNTGLNDLQKQMPKTPIDPKSGKTAAGKIAEGAKKTVGATAEVVKKGAGTASNISGNIAKSVTRVIGKIATPVTAVLETVNAVNVEQDDSLTRAEKNVEHSKSGGRVAGALAGAKAGATALSFLGPWGMIAGGLVGGLGGSLLGEEVGGFLGKLGFGVEDKPETMADKVGSAELQQTISDEDRAMNQGPIAAPSETQMFNMNIKGFEEAAQSRNAIQEQMTQKIVDVKPTISGDNLGVTVKVEQVSQQTADGKNITPIVRQGDVVNNVTNISGSRATPSMGIPPATNPTGNYQNRSEIPDPALGR